MTIDQGSPAQVPFNWCLTNICIAARGIEPTLSAQMEAGQQLKLELTDLNSSSVAINLPLDQFAKARKAPPPKRSISRRMRNERRCGGSQEADDRFGSQADLR